MNKLISILIIQLLSIFLISVSAQVTFAVVCNENTPMVVVAKDLQPHHQIVKSGFPNQRLAEEYLKENRSNFCLQNSEQIPPPRATNKKRKEEDTQNQPNTSTTDNVYFEKPENIQTSNGKQTKDLTESDQKYNRHFAVKTTLSIMYGVKELYQDQITSYGQVMGVEFGGEIFIGKRFQVGVGLHYSSLYGKIEQVKLDIISNDEQYYGSMDAFLVEICGRIPIKFNNNKWILVDLGYDSFFLVHSSLDPSYSEYAVPQIDTKLNAIRIGAGMDIKGFCFMLNYRPFFDFVSGFDDDKLYQLGLSLAYQF